ncbi:hypothetical protein [Actinomadura sp. HBU206391]|uniref:hypothetical protein n=1 Tax=Actinomadura sp. HBU206391 TaxID=2731692 RepID=UPI00164F06EE|nr:hypothetical protein [Actinomadura sp. HBU206391]MBC6458609.1 hypothetical protein [Actinomadura sp. HBU206391]
MQRIFATLTTTAVLAGVALTGCGSSDGGPAAPAPDRDLTRAEELRISDAEQRLVKGCMNRRGFSYWDWEPMTLEESRTVGYVQDDVAWARKHGYGSRIDAKATWARINNPNGAYTRTLSRERRRAYDQALDGGPDAPVLTTQIPGGGTISRRAGGCASQAQKRLYGDLATWFRMDKVADNLRRLYVPEVLRDQRFQQAVRLWSACMHRAGHPYADPAQAREAARKGTREQTGATFDKAFKTETEIAAADATCARQTSLKSIGQARQAHYIEKLTGEYGDELATHRRLHWAALARAEKIAGPRP